MILEIYDLISIVFLKTGGMGMGGLGGLGGLSALMGGRPSSAQSESTP